jgi:hypothetical protein
MDDFTDVELRIREALPGEPGVRAVEVRVAGSGNWADKSKFALDALDPLDAAYGEELGRQLTNPSLIRALDQAGLTRGANVRLRLWLDEKASELQTVRWERVVLSTPGAPCKLATSKNVALSRYILVEQPDGNPPKSVFFRLLVAVANPEGLPPSKTINVETELANFVKEFEEAHSDRRIEVSVLPGRTKISAELQARISNLGWKVISGNSTLENISDELHKSYHGLHILAHGDFNPKTGTGALLLEADTGGPSEVWDSALQSWLTSELQLIVFQACLSAAAPAEGKPPFTGLAPSLIRLGLPAAVAMQDFVGMDAARTFFSEFYRSLLDDGFVDIAVNRGRQRLINNDPLDNWSIPALFTRLRGGRLWQTDEIRESILTCLDNLPAVRFDKWPAIQVIEHTRGLTDYDPLRGASGPCFDLWGRIQELAATPGEFVVLTGPTGSSKGDQVNRLFREESEKFRDAKTGVLPIFLSLLDLTGTGAQKWPVLDRVWSGQARPCDVERLEGRSFLFLISAEEEVDGRMLQNALAAVKRLRDLSGSCVILVADEVFLPALSDFEKARLLVAQSLDKPRIVAYLKDLGNQQATTVSDELHKRGHWDLASQPRFLQHMLDLSKDGVPLTSRRTILESISHKYLARTDTRRVPRSCVEDAARKVAWKIQDMPSGDLDGSQLYTILQTARGDRDFPLGDLRQALIEDCGILTPSSNEGVRFVYPVLQSYFAASFLATEPNHAGLLEDIAASLGKASRVRRWQNVLVTLTSMLSSPADLLRSVLAGSSFMEGEQLFLAVRCYGEVSQKVDLKEVADVVDQMVDTLIWRSSWDPLRPYRDRRAALEHLIELAVVCERRRDDIVRHLATLAFDNHPAVPDLPPYDWSGIRLTAAQGLVRINVDFTASRPDLACMITAWLQLPENPQPMYAILRQDDPSLSVIAAFAIAHSRCEGKLLLDSYEHSTNEQVKWGVADALSGLEANWVQVNVVAPWVERVPKPNEAAFTTDTAACLLASHTCYLLQKTQIASPESRAFLKGCLQYGQPRLQARAMRAFAKLQDPEIERWLIPMCEAILRRKPELIEIIHVNQEQAADLCLQRAALEILRDIGNAQSLEAVRNMRLQSSNDALRFLSFQVAEQIFMRLADGINQESLKPTAFQNVREG